MIETAPKEITELTEIILDDTATLFQAKGDHLKKEQRENIRLFIPLFHKRIDTLIFLLEQYWSKKKSWFLITKIANLRNQQW